MNPFSQLESEPLPSLSQRLAPLFKQGFFRLPAGRSAPVYVDFIDRFEARSNEDGQLSHEDTLALIRDTLTLNPSAELDIDEGGDTQDLSRGQENVRKRVSQKWRCGGSWSPLGST